MSAIIKRKFKIGDRVKYNIQYVKRKATGIGTIRGTVGAMFKIKADVKVKIGKRGFRSYELASENDLEHLTLNATNDNASLWDDISDE